MSKVQIAAIVIYFILLGVCVSLLLISDSLSIAARDAIIPLASDGFKLILGAIAGTISTIVGIKSKDP